MVHESANTDGDLPNSMEGAHAARASRVSVRCDRARVCGCARAACRCGEADGASGPRTALYELTSCVVQCESESRDNMRVIVSFETVEIGQLHPKILSTRVLAHVRGRRARNGSRP